MRHVNILIVVLALVAAVLLSLSGAQTMQSMQASVYGVMNPFLRVGAAVKGWFSSDPDGEKSPAELRQEVETLRSENSELRLRNKLLGDLEEENNKLREALQYRENSVFELVPARVLARDSSTWWNTIKINKGFEEGIQEDMPVLTEQGLVGKVTTVAKNVSNVVLITDETCRVAARVQGSLEKGIVNGVRVQESGSGELELNYLTKNADLQEGTRVYSAGVSEGVFPSGIPIGVVKSFKVRDLDGQAILEPAVDVSAVEDVFVVVGAK